MLLNGSPRKGNIHTALEAFKEGLGEQIGLENVQVKTIQANDVSVSCCIACDSCGKEGDCVFDDDTNSVISDIIEADVLIFATPVYWWGMSAQLKLIVDKFYSRQTSLRKKAKKIGIIITGQLPAHNIQYRLIGQQIKCISDFLKWQVVFEKAYSAYDPGDLADNRKAISELKALAKTLI